MPRYQGPGPYIITEFELGPPATIRDFMGWALDGLAEEKAPDIDIVDSMHYAAAYAQLEPLISILARPSSLSQSIAGILDLNHKDILRPTERHLYGVPALNVADELGVYNTYYRLITDGKLPGAMMYFQGVNAALMSAFNRVPADKYRSFLARNADKHFTTKSCEQTLTTSYAGSWDYYPQQLTSEAEGLASQALQPGGQALTWEASRQIGNRDARLKNPFDLYGTYVLGRITTTFKSFSSDLELAKNIYERDLAAIVYYFGSHRPLPKYLRHHVTALQQNFAAGDRDFNADEAFVLAYANALQARTIFSHPKLRDKLLTKNYLPCLGARYEFIESTPQFTQLSSWFERLSFNILSALKTLWSWIYFWQPLPQANIARLKLGDYWLEEVEADFDRHQQTLLEKPQVYQRFLASPRIVASLCDNLTPAHRTEPSIARSLLLTYFLALIQPAADWSDKIRQTVDGLEQAEITAMLEKCTPITQAYILRALLVSGPDHHGQKLSGLQRMNSYFTDNPDKSFPALKLICQSVQKEKSPAWSRVLLNNAEALGIAHYVTSEQQDELRALAPELFEKPKPVKPIDPAKTDQDYTYAALHRAGKIDSTEAVELIGVGLQKLVEREDRSVLEEGELSAVLLSAQSPVAEDILKFPVMSFNQSAAAKAVAHKIWNCEEFWQRIADEEPLRDLFIKNFAVWGGVAGLQIGMTDVDFNSQHLRHTLDILKKVSADQCRQFLLNNPSIFAMGKLYHEMPADDFSNIRPAVEQFELPESLKDSLLSVVDELIAATVQETLPSQLPTVPAQIIDDLSHEDSELEEEDRLPEPEVFPQRSLSASSNSGSSHSTSEDDGDQPFNSMTGTYKPSDCFQKFSVLLASPPAAGVVSPEAGQRRLAV